MTYSSVLITGGTGSFGKTMVRALLDDGIPEIRILSRDEEKQDAMRSRLRDKRVKFYIGDVRDRDSVSRAVKGCDAIFHAAALKQVPSCEFFPLEAVRTNILGSENVIRSAIEHEVASLVCLSTDKAVHPINAMGISKAMMEKLAISTAREIGTSGPTTISCVRYGNVMMSRGSVIPLFIQQIMAGEKVTVTEPTMTRFLMPLRESVDLVRFAFSHAQQGDLFVRKASASTIADLATAILELFGRENEQPDVIGWRHAEKLHETLATKQELAPAEDLDTYWRIKMDGRDLNYSPYISEGKADETIGENFHSGNAEQLSIPQVKELLLSLPEIQDALRIWREGKDN